MTPWRQEDILKEPVLRYADVRPLIATGNLVFMSGNHLLSRGIKYFTNGPWSHVALLVWVQDRLLVIESVEDHGVRAVPLSRYLTYSGPVIVVRVNRLTSLQVKQIVGDALERLTTPYGYLQIFRIFTRMFFGRARTTPSQGLICSELITEAFTTGGVIFQTSIADYVTPNDIWCDSRVSVVARIH